MFSAPSPTSGCVARRRCGKRAHESFAWRTGKSFGDLNIQALDEYETELAEGDRILMCTDGLFKAVREPEIFATLTAQPDDALACASLIASANARGGPDNITLVIGTVTKKTFKEKLKDMVKKSYA